MSSGREGAPNRRAARIDSSLLHVCDAVATELWKHGNDPSLVHADVLISLLAARQDGIVAWEQLMALGIGRGVVARRVQRGTLRALHVGVYLWGAPAVCFEGRIRAAAIAGGADVFASHEASSALWAFRPAPKGPIDVTAVGRTVRARGIRGHEVTALAAADIRTCRGIRVTAPAR